jgi:hypothetical protein
MYAPWLTRIQRLRSSSWTNTFELPDTFDHSQPQVDRAIGLLALGRVNDTLPSYESALALEAAALEHFGFRYHPRECRITTGYRGRGGAQPLI